MGDRLVEMDKLLRDIQSELAPEREPAPALEDSAPLPATATATAPPPAAAPPTGAAPPAVTVPPTGAAPPTVATPPTGAAPPTVATPPTGAASPPAPEPQLQALGELSARLLASTRELLTGYERVLVPSASPPPSARHAPRHRPDSADVTLAAGPFARLEALREFEQAVSSLPGVRDVAVRGYEGSDRAIIEVRLDQANP